MIDYEKSKNSGENSMIKKILTGMVVAAGILSVGNLATLRAEEMPMKSFKNFRDIIIADDSFSAIPFVADGALSDQIRQNGIPRKLRSKIVSVKAAYEDVNIRKADPDNAVIYAFFTEKGQEKCLKLTLKNEFSSWKIAGYTETFPLAKDCVENFLARCAAGESASLKEFLAAELQTETDGIPLGLRPEAAEGISGKAFQISGGTSHGMRDSVNVRYLTDSGRITLVRDGYFWKITAIDSALTAEKPLQFIKRFCSECKNPPEAPPAPAAETAPEAAEKKDGEESDSINPVSKFAFIADFFTPEDMESMKGNLEKNITRAAGFKEVKRQSTNSSPEIEITIDSAEETGTMIFKLKRNAGKWAIAKIDSSAVFTKTASPDKIAQDFVSNWFKDGNPENVKSMTNAV